MKNRIIPFLILFVCSTDISAINLDWAKSISGGFNYANDMKQDNNGSILVCGAFNGVVDFDPGPGVSNVTSTGNDDAYLLKLDNNGNFMWVKTVGGQGNESYIALAVDNQNNIVATLFFDATIDADPGPGTSSFTGNGLEDLLLCKFDNAGIFIWAKQFGSTEDNYFSKPGIDPCGNIVFTITFQNALDADPNAGIVMLNPSSTQDLAIIKISQQGNLIWSKKITGSLSNRLEGTCILFDNNCNLMYAGTFDSTVDFDPGPGVYNLQTNYGASNMFISKLDSTGNFIWARSFDCNYESGVVSLEADGNGNIIFGGAFELVLDADPGPGTTMFYSDYYDLFLIKLNSSGNFIWGRQIGGPGMESLWSHTVDNAGNIYFTGHFEDDSVDMDAGPNTMFINPVGGSDIIIAKYDANGNFVWAKQCVGNTQSVFNAGVHVELDNNENLLVAGVFEGVVDFDPNAGVYNLTAAQTNTCVFKFIQNPLAVSTASPEDPFSIYPNPFNSTLQVQYKVVNSGKAMLEVTNIFGQSMLKSNLSSDNETAYFDTHAWSNGIYFYSYTVNDIKVSSGKILKK